MVMERIKLSVGFLTEGLLLPMVGSTEGINGDFILQLYKALHINIKWLHTKNYSGMW